MFGTIEKKENSWTHSGDCGLECAVLDVAKYQETGSIMQHYAIYSTARICLDPGISHAELENWNVCRRSLIFGWCAGP